MFAFTVTIKLLDTAGMTPAFFISLVNQICGCAGFFRPFDDRFGHAADVQQFIISTISALFFRGRPFDVFFLVIPVRIYSLDRMIRTRSFADRLKEFFKILEKKFNAATAVNCITAVSRRFATGFRITVSPVFGGDKTRDGLPVSRSVDSGDFAHQAAARFTVAPRQGGTVYPADFGAIAPAEPKGSVGVYSGKSENRPAAELAAGQVFKLRVFWNRLKANANILLSHFVYSPEINNLIRLGQVLPTSARAVFILTQQL